MTDIDSSIFKAYDIRGIYGKNLDEDIAYRVGRAYADLLKSESRKKNITVVVGHDMRTHSLSLTKQVITGITAQGVDVVDVGLVSTPTFYFAVAKYGYDGGLQVSASHNPAEYNGFKMTRANAIPISGETGIMTIRDAVIANTFEFAVEKGTIIEREGVIADHVSYALSLVDVSKIKPFKVVVDSANAMGGPLFQALFKHLPCEYIPINLALDGTFPSHEADPLKDENNKQLQEKVLDVGADIGLALDGDCDRIFFISNEGKTVEPAIIRGILAQIFLRDNPGATIGYDIRPGRITEDLIRAAGGVPVVTKVGHSLIKEKMREVDAVFAGESSGHFFMKMPFGTFEMPMVMALKIMEELSVSGKSFSEYVQPLYRYYNSGEINFEVKDKQSVFDRLRTTYGDHLKYDFDGLTFEWPDWWFNVRASNTENKLRLNLEATSSKTMKAKRDEVSALLSR